MKNFKELCVMAICLAVFCLALTSCGNKAEPEPTDGAVSSEKGEEKPLETADGVPLAPNEAVGEEYLMLSNIYSFDSFSEIAELREKLQGGNKDAPDGFQKKHGYIESSEETRIFFDRIEGLELPILGDGDLKLSGMEIPKIGKSWNDPFLVVMHYVGYVPEKERSMGLSLELSTECTLDELIRQCQEKEDTPILEKRYGEIPVFFYDNGYSGIPGGELYKQYRGYFALGSSAVSVRIAMQESLTLEDYLTLLDTLTVSTVAEQIDMEK